ncbi:hypothetical protein BJ123_113162 [Rhodopseudomonas thermotolerans]|uniref:Uncharacterized protein n=2 Tax=Rhodopseudomonas TaxID=1073 RepID=A0A336JQ56_9BRAD|nr:MULTISPECIES: hypothetical protein [Rhodopseudomonas]RED32068.1 hypothetical protein BJ125_113162 [Rhodopseudomonas pentothenatexigens]REF93449.1 hypothetical protein BJ123_113162 [Rhodopseudomonas thermotolerans]SSW91740.1 hypothetical protein SAMN05892882_113162 [Rhodopseudomonas pentothenatexigens]
MTSITNGLTNYAQQYGAAYARTAGTQTSLASILNAGSDEVLPSASNAATQLTLSAAARAQLAGGSSKDYSAAISDSRAAIDKLYKAANVSAPYDASGKPTIDLSTLDRRALFAIASNAGGRFTDAEQTLAATNRIAQFNAALSPATQTAKLIGDYSTVYKAAASYLDGASSEEKATATWQAERAAITKGLAATQSDPSKIPTGISNDPVAAYLARYPSGSTTTTQDFGSVAKQARAALDDQAKQATAAGKLLVYDPARKTGQQADLSVLDNRALSAISLNKDDLFSKEEVFAAKRELDSRNRASILTALKQSQTSGNPADFSLGLLNAYAGMSAEERTATNWTPTFRDNAVQSYKATNSLLSMLKGS